MALNRLECTMWIPSLFPGPKLLKPVPKTKIGLCKSSEPIYSLNLNVTSLHLNSSSHAKSFALLCVRRPRGFCLKCKKRLANLRLYPCGPKTP
eukprot:4020820-Amphidinium_carterae.1